MAEDGSSSTGVGRLRYDFENSWGKLFLLAGVVGGVGGIAGSRCLAGVPGLNSFFVGDDRSWEGVDCDSFGGVGIASFKLA